MPKTVTADTAATPSARFLFFSIFFSSFNLDNKSVTLTLLLELSYSDWLLSKLKCVLILSINSYKALTLNTREGQNGLEKKTRPKMS